MCLCIYAHPLLEISFQQEEASPCWYFVRLQCHEQKKCAGNVHVKVNAETWKIQSSCSIGWFKGNQEV